MKPVTLTGLPVDELSVKLVIAGHVTADDARIHPDTLRHQAEVAECHGNPQLGENLRRAAELSTLADDYVLRIYDALRPGRSSDAQLTAIADDLEQRAAPRCAALVREAIEVYRARGLID